MQKSILYVVVITQSNQITQLNRITQSNRNHIFKFTPIDYYSNLMKPEMEFSRRNHTERVFSRYSCGRIPVYSFSLIL